MKGGQQQCVDGWILFSVMQERLCKQGRATTFLFGQETAKLYQRESEEVGSLSV